MWLGGDGFDMYSATADVQRCPEQWDVSNSSQYLIASANAHFRFGGSPGGFLILGNQSVTAVFLESVDFPGGVHPNTLFVNFNILHTQGGGSRMGFVLKDGANNQVGFWSEGGTFVVTAGDIATTVLATAPAGLCPLTVACHLQVKIVIHPTAGSVEVRRFGAATATWLVTGLNTRNGSANSYATRIRFKSNSADGVYMDDLYWHDDTGLAPNTFMGDVRCMHYSPNADDSVQWSRNTGATNASAVDDPPSQVGISGNDGDATYNFSNTAGQVDRFLMAALSPVPDSIICVQSKMNYRMDDAGPHTCRLRVTSGATVVDNPIVSCTNQYIFTQQANPVNPATGSPWTVAEVNAMKLGYVIVT